MNFRAATISQNEKNVVFIEQTKLY